MPADAVSGIYFAKLRAHRHRRREPHRLRRPQRRQPLATCCSRPPTPPGRPTTPTAATASTSARPAGRAYKVSYNRPFTTRRHRAGGLRLQRRVPDGPLARGQRLRRQLHHRRRHRPPRRALLKNHKVFLSVGHDEYWSGSQRANVEAARDAGVNLAFFSGNEVFWKTRWENSIDGSGTPYRTLVSYKETHANAKIDPPTRTSGPAPGATRASARPADGGRPENALTGTLFTVNCCTTAMTVPAADGKLRFWRNTRVATLGRGRDARPSAPAPLGYEWDEDLDNGFRPAGPDPPVHRPHGHRRSVLQDYGTTYAHRHGDPPPDAVPRAQRRAGLRRRHGPVVLGPRRQPRPRLAATADVAVQQATVNLFADMGAQPATLQSGLVAATASTDTTAPDLDDHLAGRRRDGPRRRSRSPITGTATDAGGGGSAASRSRSTAARPGTRPPGAASLDLHVHPGARPAPSTIRTPGRRRQRQPRDARSAGVTVDVGAAAGGTCPCTHLAEHRDPGRRGRPRHRPGRARREVPRQPGRLRSPASASTRAPATPAPTSAPSGPPPAPCSPRPPSPARRATGWQQVSFATPVAVTAEHHLRRVLLRTQRPLRRQRRLLHRPPSPTARSPPWPTAPTAPTASTGTAAGRVPDQRLRAVELLGRRRLHHRRRRHDQADRDRADPGGRGDQRWPRPAPSPRPSANRSRTSSIVATLSRPGGQPRRRPAPRTTPRSRTADPRLRPAP